MPINIQAFETVFASTNPSVPGVYEMYYRTAPNTSWKDGPTGPFFDFSCSGSVPRNLWTLCKRSSAADSITTVPLDFPLEEQYDTFWLAGKPKDITIPATCVDTAKTIKQVTLSCLHLHREIRGIWLTGAALSETGGVL